ncbi:MAG: hypothetical protein AB7O96_04595 [Pseudobdellovibrionaceae bacterium]
MKLVFTLLLISSVIGGSAIAQQSLSDAGYLRKLSLHLRGVPPSLEEYKAMKIAKSQNGFDAFINEKVDEYTATSQHANKMMYRLSELFYLRTNDRPEGFESDETRSYGSQYDALTNLFTSMAKENRPWDDLLKSKRYNFTVAEAIRFDFSYSGAFPDQQFFSLIEPSLVGKSDEIESPIVDNLPKQSYVLRLDEDDVRVAGSLTTSRFLSRFSTNAVNKNRRRAAAVYRIFLCDPMVASIPTTEADAKHKFLEATFAKQYKVSEQDIVQNLDAKLHGNDDKCFACHMKLDPMGQTFRKSNVTLGKAPVAGALVLKRENGKVDSFPAKGIGDLAASIAQQPEYVECQVRWFWKEFIGEDIPLPKEKMRSLIKDFDKVQRKTNDFIKVVVTSPEFRTQPITALTFNDVAPILKRCDTCHVEQGMTSFAALPIESAETHGQWLKRITRALTRPDNDPMKMPKESHLWNKKDIEKILVWINQGAPDNQGQPTAGVHP